MIEWAAVPQSPPVDPMTSFDRWTRELWGLCGEAPIVTPPCYDFAGHVDSGVVGGVRIATIGHNAPRLVRHARPAACQDILLLVLTQGRATIAQRGSRVEMEAGDTVLLDSHADFVLEQNGASCQTIAYLPARELLSSVGGGRLPPLQRHSSSIPMVSILARMFDGILPALANIAGEEGRSVRRMLIEAARTLLAKQLSARTPGAERVFDVRIRDYIDAHLADPELDPARIADACNISIRRVHRAFEDTPWTACNWIRKERLERCHADLRDPALAHLSVTQIAFRWGFNDAAHFSRSFRDHFGTTPSLARRQADSAEVVAFHHYNYPRGKRALSQDRQ